LELAEAACERTRYTAGIANLRRLSSAEPSTDPQVFKDSAEVFVSNAERLIRKPADLPAVRQTIIDLAVRGRLSTRDVNDTPAIATLAERALSTQSFVQPWVVPPGWEWTSFAQLGIVQGGGTPSKDISEYWHGTIPWVTPKDMKVDYIADSQDHLSIEAIRRSSAKLLPAGTLLMVVRGMILAHSFPVALTQEAVTINQDMKGLTPFLSDLGEMLLVIAKGMKPLVLDLVERSTHGTCRLATDRLLALPIPFPPLAEQHRIVSRVNELMAVCDELERNLEAIQSQRTRFLEAVLAEALAGSGSDEFPSALST